MYLFYSLLLLAIPLIWSIFRGHEIYVLTCIIRYHYFSDTIIVNVFRGHNVYVLIVLFVIIIGISL